MLPGASTLGRMTRVMAVAFEPRGQLHYLDAGEERYRVGEAVLHPTQDGPEVAHVVWAPDEVTLETPLPACGGRASDQDLARDAANRERRAETLAVVRELVTRHELEMTVHAVDLTSDDQGALVAVYFTAPGRVDFRELLRDLLPALGSRVDLRQVGPRDATRVTGGIGNCGRMLCCSTWLTDLQPVSIRVAQAQGITNPLAIAGMCGRLMCCLAYECEAADDCATRRPRRTDTEEGPR